GGRVLARDGRRRVRARAARGDARFGTGRAGPASDRGAAPRVGRVPEPEEGGPAAARERAPERAPAGDLADPGAPRPAARGRGPPAVRAEDRGRCPLSDGPDGEGAPRGAAGRRAFARQRVRAFDVAGSDPRGRPGLDRKSTRLNSSHVKISYA